MNECLIQLFLATIGESYKKSTESNLIGRINLTLQAVFKQFLIKYGKFTPIDLEANRQRMCAPWDASAPIEDLFQQINVAAEFSVYARHPIAANDLVQAGELLILKTGAFGQAYKD